MPFPLMPVIAVVVSILGAGAAAAAITKLAKSLSGKRVAILGRQEVGKTTLLQFLRDREAPMESKRTVDPIPGEEFDMQIDGNDVHWKVKKDLPGNDSPAYKHWKDAFDDSDFVWYLFRADLIANGDADEAQGVKEHLNMLKSWRKERESNPPKIILIGTWADKCTEFNDDWKAFNQVVKDTQPITNGSLGLEADVVVGSLATTDAANKLAERIGRYLK